MRKLLSLSILVALLFGWTRARADGPANLQCKNMAPDPAYNPDTDSIQALNCFDGDVFVLDGRPIDCDTTNCGMDCDPNAPEDVNQQFCQFTGEGKAPSSQPRVCDPETRKCKTQLLSCAPYQSDPTVPSGCKQWVRQETNVLKKLYDILGKNSPEHDNIVFWSADYKDATWPYAEKWRSTATGIGNVHALSKQQAEDYHSAFRADGTIPAGTTSAVEDELNDPYICPSNGVACNIAQGYVNILDSLAMAEAAKFEPFVSFPPAMRFGGTELTQPGSLNGRTWSSFADIKGSLFGGNNWRDNGNGTFETALPPPLHGLIPPFDGQVGLIFTPLDLYLMGLGAKGDVPPITLFDVTSATPIKPLLPNGKPPAGYGAGMGIAPGVQIRPGIQISISIDDIIQANGGARNPSFDSSQHRFRQLWVALALPAQSNGQGGFVSSLPKKSINKGGMTSVDGALVKLQRWRRTFNWYFYMLTHWRGRMVTTFEGDVDDSPYWEFGDARDDLNAFDAEGGLALADPPIVDVATPPVGNGALVVSTPGEAGKLTFRGVQNQINPLKVRIDPSYFTAALIRMRIPTGVIPPKTAHARVSFPNGPQNVQIPGNDAAFLIPDGLWHTYSTNLSQVPGWVEGGLYDRVTFTPSDTAASHIEIDFVRLIGGEKAGKPIGQDSDLECGSTVKPQPDGWVDEYDNCPTIYNPGQEDGNGDGIGDACEDFDGDGIPNACDNCPTLSNSRQRDTNHNGVGDVCDPTQGAGCCLTPDALGGVVKPLRPGVFALLTGLLVGALVFRRRRRR